ncbi:hypothetical protein [uncultured Xanthomonas sp.]|nr:hypothetical protein [uncultured Xanthomonas sp.]
MSVEHMTLNGQPPALEGLECTGFVVQHFYEDFALSDPACAVCLCFGEVWYRIYFEAAAVFWRESEPPGNPVNSTLSHGLLLNDLSEMPGVVGHRLSSIACSGTARGDVEVRLAFAHGTSILLNYDVDAGITRICESKSLGNDGVSSRGST